MKEFSLSAQKLSRNPLGILALFLVLIYGISSFVFTFSQNLPDSLTLLFTLFIVIYPFIVLYVFYKLVTEHHTKLYAPIDYPIPEHFKELAYGPTEEKVVIGKEPEKVLTPVSNDTINLMMKNEFILHFQIGKQFIESGNLSAAIPHFKKVLKLNPNHWLSAMYLGFIYGENHNNPEYNLYESIFYSTYAIKLDKNHFNQFLNLALAQIHTGNENLIMESIKNFNESENVIKRDPNKNRPILVTQLAKIYKFKGEAFERLENSEDALISYKEAYKIFESFPDSKSDEIQKWMNDTKRDIERLEKT